MVKSFYPLHKSGSNIARSGGVEQRSGNSHADINIFFLLCDGTEKITQYRYTDQQRYTDDLFNNAVFLPSADHGFLIERNQEIAGNFTTGRERFEREFTRAKANGIKVFLIIEGASWSDVMLGNYRSKLQPQSFMAALLSWQVRFNITILFCKPSETPRLLHGILYYWVRHRLKRG